MWGGRLSEEAAGRARLPRSRMEFIFPQFGKMLGFSGVGFWVVAVDIDVVSVGWVCVAFTLSDCSSRFSIPKRLLVFRRDELRESSAL